MTDDMCVVVCGGLQILYTAFGAIVGWTGPDRRDGSVTFHARQFVLSVQANSNKSQSWRFGVSLSILSLELCFMKNIAISGTWRLVVPGSNITTAIVDVDRACLWIASERLNADADVEIDIYKKGIPDDSYEMEDVSAFAEGLRVMNWSRKAMQIHCDCR